MRKLDVTGITIYAGLAGVVVGLVGTLAVTVLWSLIFGA
jgi:hypothetical protein